MRKEGGREGEREGQSKEGRRGNEKGEEEKGRREDRREEGCHTSCTLCLCPAAAAPCRALSSFTSNLRRTLTSVY